MSIPKLFGNKGLDKSYVSGYLLSNETRVEKISESIDKHFYNNAGYVAWSGGKDSTCVAHLANSIIPNIPIVWFNSGLEFPDTQPYVERIAKKYNFNIRIYNVSPNALEVLRDTGTWDHDSVINPEVANLHRILITMPSDQAHSIFGVGELSGLRAEESAGRRVLLSKNKGVYNRLDGSKVYAPIWSWSSEQVDGYLAANSVEINPVYKKLEDVGAPRRAQRVGLTVDGNNPDFGRYTYLRLAYPDLWNELCMVLPRLKEWR